MAKPQTILSSDAVKGIQADDFLPWVTAILKAWPPSPERPAPSRLELQLFYLPFQPYSCGTGVAGALPTIYSFQGFILFICVACLGGQGHLVLATGQTQDNTTPCVRQGRFLGFNCVWGILA